MSSSSSFRPTKPSGWLAPPPLRVLDWQRRQEAFTRSNLCHLMLRTALENGHWTLLPLPGEIAALPPAAINAEFAALTLMMGEADRLRSARSYSVGANATGLAVAATAGSSPGEAISLDRAPSPHGLMLFADPIGSDVAMYDTPAGPVEIHTPIVAVSWSVWDGTRHEVGGRPVTWMHHNPDGAPSLLDPSMRGVWMTFYAPRVQDTVGIDPDQPVAVDQDGSPVTAAQSVTADMSFQRRDPHLFGPLAWNNELVLPEGDVFGDIRPHTAQEWAATVYTTWQIMQQSGRSLLTEERRHTLPPAARKKAAAKARTTGAAQKIGDGAVRVVDLAAPARPPQQAADRDKAASDGRRTVNWSCRWPVPPYRRSTCTNPYLHHKLNDTLHEHHEHREEIMPLRIKGPADKPLRMPSGTTFTFDTPSS
ncbi:hypothetical protein [Streptomyces zhihengii]|uniref:Uncharacterized protein n=1 Tax=Streptomyces zhihengii TaxID=1818004 RepID=A0ABS2V5G4_9ACTN|nr:hypothetical protein [Streptomyces zhihengii]MBM9624684.1 hypothetical protein [Streptomyces zhihengii]